MTARLITPVIPPVRPTPTQLGTAAAHGSAAMRALPLAAPPLCPSPAIDVLYRLSSLDASGRVSDRAVTDALGWLPGDRLTLTATGGIVLIRRDQDGPASLLRRARIAIPASLRRRCWLTAGDRVLLAAYLSLDAVAAYCLPLVYRALHPPVALARPAHEQRHDA